eukprot:6167760-Prymnesium_polylepis.1
MALVPDASGSGSSAAAPQALVLAAEAPELPVALFLGACALEVDTSAVAEVDMAAVAVVHSNSRRGHRRTACGLWWWLVHEWSRGILRLQAGGRLGRLAAPVVPPFIPSISGGHNAGEGSWQRWLRRMPRQRSRQPPASSTRSPPPRPPRTAASDRPRT